MDREHRNVLGQAVDQWLDRAEALSIEAEALSIESARKSPPTFLRLIREGKLPVSPAMLPGP